LICPTAFAACGARSKRRESISSHRFLDSLLGRIGNEEDVAGAAIYLASRAGDYVVGATLTVDGGIVYANPGIKGSGWDS
jgi:NAD(P)-dependent dehydrogenase (short-subunit alcohol dehydrogenase family)